MTDAKESDDSVLRLAEHHAHALPHPHQGRQQGKAGRWQSEYHDTMCDHDELVGSVLDYLDENGLAENTIVMYSTDNGPHMNSWPDAGMTRSATRRTRTGKAPTGCRRWSAGPGRSRPGGCSTASSATRTGSSPCSRLPVTRRRRPAEGRCGPGRLDVQGAPRRPQPARLRHRGRRGESAPALLLRVRRRRPGRPALDNWKFVFLQTGHVQAEHLASRSPSSGSRAVQPEDRSVRTGRPHVQHLLRLGARPRLPVHPGPGLRRQLIQTLREFLAAPGTSELQHRPGAVEAQRRVPSS